MTLTNALFPKFKDITVVVGICGISAQHFSSVQVVVSNCMCSGANVVHIK